MTERLGKHLAHDHALLDQQNPIGQTANEIEALFDHHNRQALMAMQSDQNFQNLFHDRRLNSLGRLIQQQ